MTRNLESMLKASEIGTLLPDFVPKNFYTLTTLRERACNFSIEKELVQTLEFSNDGTTFQVDIGDQALLSSIGFFDDHLFGHTGEFSSLDDFIISSAKKSGLEVTKTQKKKTKSSLDVILVGGASKIRGLAQYLEQKLIAYYTQKSKVDATIKISVMSPKSPDQLSWKGASIVTNLESSEQMWIKREDFVLFGMKSVKEKVPFKL